MVLLRSLLALAAAAAAAVVANPLSPRQTTNTNVQINQVVDSLDESVHINIPNINTLQAEHQANDATVGPQIDQLVTAFNTVTNDLKNIPVSAGSNTTMPTNDDIAITYSTALSIVASGLSGLTTAIVPSLHTFLAPLDTAMANSVNQLNTTLPLSGLLVHIMMLDARQFLTRQGLNVTNAALGF